MSETKKSMGKISISYNAIATIAFQSALESYGVVGLATENIARGISNLFTKTPISGVVVQYDGDIINIDLYIIVEYGTRIASVTQSVANNVKFNVEKMVGIPVNEVNVHVRGLRVSDTD
ncbi:MAG: Asp23/Gls24 family envelope stress response protein [Anaerolineae bacterium]|jgi:uncharacterized alkaline shock family protein YloU|nr:Asp23/Gls24 family envelope stress response protein [Anaerolineae bacterium]